MHEATKSIKRRGIYNDVLFKGKGIDIGAGPDCISKHGYDAYNWDLKDGDAQYLASVPNNYYDFVHSSHCLEHMMDPKIAIKHWVRVCKSGGYIVIVIPDEELYEHNTWPSQFNNDHKWSFRICSPNKLHNRSINITDLLKLICKDVETISIKRIEDKYNFNLLKAMLDQTGPVDGPECAIELILRKN